MQEWLLSVEHAKTLIYFETKKKKKKILIFEHFEAQKPIELICPKKRECEMTFEKK